MPSSTFWCDFGDELDVGLDGASGERRSMRISDFLDDVFDEQRRLLLRQKESAQNLDEIG